ncbi:MAG: hypothetical protein CL677_05590 [Bdellovibrionaceae bacterium]|nr:hypothetical protein [Pseudobdellovibrionaceae bacterium]
MKSATTRALTLALLLSSPVQVLALDLDKEIAKQNQISSGIVIALNNRNSKKTQLKAGSSYEDKGYKITLVRKGQ